MSKHRQLPKREQVFILSLMYHGYRVVHRRHRLKKKKGYIIPTTKHDDSGGIDFWIKPPGHSRIVPVQITQRGVALHKKHDQPSPEKLHELIQHAKHRLRKKRRMCARCKIVFVLVRDFDGEATNKTLAWGDIKALWYGLARLKY